jgi:hypothetical protein
MSTEQSAKPASEVYAIDLSKLRGTLKALGGSMDDGWNSLIASQTVQTLWLKNLDAEEIRRRSQALAGALIGIRPRDELEGMLAAQLIAAYNASMECFRRAMLGEQTLEGRRENLNQANKLARTYATLLEALNRHRGKGQQKVTVEHVHIHSGGQAVVGVVETAGGGDRAKQKDQPHAKQIAHAPQPAMRRADAERESLPVARDAERPLPDARRKIARRTDR